MKSRHTWRMPAPNAVYLFYSHVLQVVLAVFGPFFFLAVGLVPSCLLTSLTLTCFPLPPSLTQPFPLPSTQLLSPVPLPEHAIDAPLVTTPCIVSLHSLRNFSEPSPYLGLHWFSCGSSHLNSRFLAPLPLLPSCSAVHNKVAFWGIFGARIVRASISPCSSRFGSILQIWL